MCLSLETCEKSKETKVNEPNCDYLDWDWDWFSFWSEWFRRRNEFLGPSQNNKIVAKQFIITLVSQNNFQLSFESNPELHWPCFTLICDWFRKLTPLSQPIRYKTIRSPRFPALLAVCFYFTLSSDWHSGIFFFLPIVRCNYFTLVQQRSIQKLSKRTALDLNFQYEWFISGESHQSGECSNWRCDSKRRGCPRRR